MEGFSAGVIGAIVQGGSLGALILLLWLNYKKDERHEKRMETMSDSFMSTTERNNDLNRETVQRNTDAIKEVGGKLKELKNSHDLSNVKLDTLIQVTKQNGNGKH